MNPLTLLTSLLLAGCINPFEGDYGPVDWVPEQDTCWVKVRHPGGRINYEIRPCDGPGHDIKIFGRRW